MIAVLEARYIRACVYYSADLVKSAGFYKIGRIAYLMVLALLQVV